MRCTRLLLIFCLCLPAAAEAPDLLAPLPAERWDAAKAAHLLRRAGFGGTPDEVARLTQMPFDRAIAWVVDYQDRPQGQPLKFAPEDYNRNARVDQAVLKLIPRIKEKIRPQLARRYADRLHEYSKEQIEQLLQREAERQAVSRVVQTVIRQYQFQLRSWWLARMARTARPLEEKMALFWHGHFATSFDTVRNPYYLKLQNDLFRQQAVGNFKELVLGICRDPAMLQYLDGNRNTKKKPNENFARELLELFTLGIGNYAEADIKAAARAFTGWTSVAHVFFFNRAQHDYGAKTFLGKTGHWNGTDIVDIIFEQPQAARFITAKLCRYLVCDDPPAGVVAGLAATLRASDYQLRPLLRRIFSSRWFYTDAVIGNQIKCPVQLAVGTIRQLGLPDEGLAIAGNLLGKMGQDLFRPPNVKGWDGGRAWINSSTMMARYNFLADLVGAGRKLNANPQAMTLRKTYLPDSLRGKPSRWDERTLLGLPFFRTLENLDSAEAAVDYLCGLLLARPLSDRNRARLLALLGKGRFDPRSRRTRGQLLRAILLITSTPEYQLG